MCKITAVDVGMCLPKCFVIIVNLFTFILGLLIFGAFIFAMAYVKTLLGHGGLSFLFYVPIAFGGIILLISFFGCCGACLKNRCMLMTFAIFLLIIFVCQIGVVYVVYDVFAQINQSVSAYLTNTIESAKDEPEDERIMYYIWEVIQNLFECCGVNSLTDWQTLGDESLPISCCPMRNETEVTDIQMSQNATTCSYEDAFTVGCKSLVTNQLDMSFHPVTVGVTVVLAIQLINLILACCMFFVYSWTNKRNTRIKTFSVTSDQTVRDQFIVKNDRF